MLAEIFTGVLGSLFGGNKSSQPQQTQPEIRAQRYDVVGNLTQMAPGGQPMYNPSPVAQTFGYNPAATITTPQAPAVKQPFAGDPAAYVHQYNEQRKGEERKAEADALALKRRQQQLLFGVHDEMARENPFYGVGLSAGRGLYGLFSAPKQDAAVVQQELF